MAEEKKHPSLIKAVRAHCLGCAGGSPVEVARCPITRCDLYPYRFGLDPFRKPRVLSEEQKAAAVERLSKYRENARNLQGDSEKNDGVG